MNWQNLIRKNSKGSRVLLLFIVTSIIYVIMLAVTIPKVVSYAPDYTLFDMMPAGYNADYAGTLLEALGDQGRDAYLFNQLPFDMVYPLLFGITYCLLLAYFLNKVGKMESGWRYFCLLPLCAGLFDYFENISIIGMLTSFPGDISALAQVASVFTILKSFLTSIYFVVLLIWLIVWLYNLLKNK